MKKLFNKLSNSGKIDVDSLREDTYSGEHTDSHVRKPTSLPSDARDTSQEIKLKKSFSGSGSLGRSSSGIKSPKSPKDKAGKEKLNESDDKALRKSGSRKNSMKKSAEVKNPDSMKSPSLKGIFGSSYGQQKDSGLVDSDLSESEDESVPRSRGNSMHDDVDDEFYTTMPIRVPSAPGRLASSPVPLHSTPPPAALHVSPVPYSPHAMAYSPPASPFHPVAVPTTPTSGAQVPTLPRSVSTPSPRVAQNVVAADDFDFRFGVVGRGRAESITDEHETSALGSGFARGHAEEEEDADMFDGEEVEVTNQKGKSGGLFSPRKNKAKKLK